MATTIVKNENIIWLEEEGELIAPSDCSFDLDTKKKLKSGKFLFPVPQEYKKFQQLFLLLGVRKGKCDE